MTVYIDELRQWPTSIRCFKAGSCHMFADSIDELHAFAKQIGLKRGWFQDERHPHYDLTPARRERALALGATETTTREFLSRSRANGAFLLRALRR